MLSSVSYGDEERPTHSSMSRQSSNTADWVATAFKTSSVDAIIESSILTSKDLQTGVSLLKEISKLSFLQADSLELYHYDMLLLPFSMINICYNN